MLQPQVVEEGQARLVALRVARVKGIGRHPVGALHQDRRAVYLEAELAAVTAGDLGAVQLQGANAHLVLPPVHHLAVVQQLAGHLVKVRIAIPFGPPQPRPLHGDGALPGDEVDRALLREAALAADAGEAERKSVQLRGIGAEVEVDPQGGGGVACGRGVVVEVDNLGRLMNLRATGARCLRRSRRGDVTRLRAPCGSRATPSSSSGAPRRGRA